MLEREVHRKTVPWLATQRDTPINTEVAADLRFRCPESFYEGRVLALSDFRRRCRPRIRKGEHRHEKGQKEANRLHLLTYRKLEQKTQVGHVKFSI